MTMLTLFSSLTGSGYLTSSLSSASSAKADSRVFFCSFNSSRLAVISSYVFFGSASPAGAESGGADSAPSSGGGALRASSSF